MKEYSIELQKLLDIESDIELLKNQMKKATEEEKVAIAKDIAKLKRQWNGQFQKIGDFYR